MRFCRVPASIRAGCRNPLLLLFFPLQPCLNALGEIPKVGHTLKFVIRQFHTKMILEAGEQFQRLQAVDPELLEKIIVRRQLLSRNTKRSRCKAQNFLNRLIERWHVYLK